MGRVSKERQEYRRLMVERLLQSDLSVDEWSKNNGISRATMYNWLSELSQTEPELFGGKQNIADPEKRNWLQITRKNIAEASALAIRNPGGVLIVDSNSDTVPAEAVNATTSNTGGTSSIQVAINGTHVAIPAGSAQTDIANVLQVVSCL